MPFKGQTFCGNPFALLLDSLHSVLCVFFILYPFSSDLINTIIYHEKRDIGTKMK